MSGQQRPAAKATRVGRQSSPSVPAASEQEQSEEHPVQQQPSKHADDFSGMPITMTCTHHKPAHELRWVSHGVCILPYSAYTAWTFLHTCLQQSTQCPCAGLLPGMLGILTDVQEKPVSGHISAPSAPAGGSAFPKATHRKLSKVCTTHAAGCALRTQASTTARSRHHTLLPFLLHTHITTSASAHTHCSCRTSDDICGALTGNIDMGCNLPCQTCARYAEALHQDS